MIWKTNKVKYMNQYINKSAVVAEIERIMDAENENINSFEQHRNTSEKQRYNTRMALLEHILSFLDTLEVKEVDLDKEIKKYINDNICGYCLPGTEETAKYFFELGLKTKGE